MSSVPDYYGVLGVTQASSPLDIKQAFRRLARQYHPDLHPDNPDAAETFKQVCTAYEVLKDPIRRAQYDQGFPDTGRSDAPPQPFQAFYLEGVAKLSGRDYKGAIAKFTQAIQQNPQFTDAYLGRCQAAYVLGDDRAVLEDCYQLSQLDPDLAQAYYYQGRARARLGYSKGAIEAYTQAIAKDEDYAQAYYRRGLAYCTLEDLAAAQDDLKLAAQLFRAQGEFQRQEQAEQALASLNPGARKWAGSGRAPMGKIMRDAVRDVVQILRNPSGNLLPLFSRLTQRQAAGMGLLYAVLSWTAIATVGELYWSQSWPLSAQQVWVLGIVIWAALILMGALLRLLTRQGGSWAGDVFVAGVTLLPLAMLMILSVPLSSLGSGFMAAASMFTLCYSVLLLYAGCTQISDIPESMAVLAVPFMFVIISSLASFVMASP